MEASAMAWFCFPIDEKGKETKTGHMKKTSLFVLMAILTTLSSCELVQGIFKAGVWAGVLMVVGVVALVFFLISRLFGGGK
jgi:heme/copper-type cytochrome/quinol oxidase subunit 4